MSLHAVPQVLQLVTVACSSSWGVLQHAGSALLRACTLTLHSGYRVIVRMPGSAAEDVQYIVNACHSEASRFRYFELDGEHRCICAVACAHPRHLHAYPSARFRYDNAVWAVLGWRLRSAHH